MDTFTRICKKCLLREMSEADTYKTMYEYIANLNPWSFLYGVVFMQDLMDITW